MNDKDTDRLFRKLSPEQQKKVMDILSDKKQTEKLLQTPQAPALLKKLRGEKNNG